MVFIIKGVTIQTTLLETGTAPQVKVAASKSFLLTKAVKDLIDLVSATTFVFDLLVPPLAVTRCYNADSISWLDRLRGSTTNMDGSIDKSKPKESLERDVERKGHDGDVWISCPCSPVP